MNSTTDQNIGEEQPHSINKRKAWLMVLAAMLTVLAVIFCGTTSLWCRRQYQIYVINKQLERERGTPMTSCCANQPRVSDERSAISDPSRSQSFQNDSQDFNKLVRKKKSKKKTKPSIYMQDGA